MSSLNLTPLPFSPTLPTDPPTPYPYASCQNRNGQPTFGRRNVVPPVLVGRHAAQVNWRSRCAATLLYEPTRITTRVPTCFDEVPCLREGSWCPGGDPSTACKGSGFKSPQLHPRSEVLFGFDRPRIARLGQQLGSNLLCEAKLVVRHTVDAGQHRRGPRPVDRAPTGPPPPAGSCATFMPGPLSELPVRLNVCAVDPAFVAARGADEGDRGCPLTTLSARPSRHAIAPARRAPHVARL